MAEELRHNRAEKYICVFQVSGPYLGFAQTLNILWIVSKILSKNGIKCYEKCNFYVKYFDKIIQVAHRATIAHQSPMCPKTLCSLSPTPKPYAAFPLPQLCYT